MLMIQKKISFNFLAPKAIARVPRLSKNIKSQIAISAYIFAAIVVSLLSVRAAKIQPSSPRAHPLRQLLLGAGPQ